MVQFLPQEPGLGALLGTGVGQGMTQGFEQMRQGGALGQMLGLKPEETQALGRMPAQMQQMLGTVLMKQRVEEAQSKSVLDLYSKLKGGVIQGSDQPFSGNQTSLSSPEQPSQTEQPQTTQSGITKFTPPNDPGLINILKSHPNKAFQGMADSLLEENKAARKDWQFTIQSGQKEKELALKQQKAAGLMSPQKAQSFQSTIGRMKELLPYVGTPFGTKTFGGVLRRETVQKRNEFDTSVSYLMSFLRDLDSKGQLPKGIFQELLKRLPSSKLTERENMGRLEAIEGIISDISGTKPSNAQKEGSLSSSMSPSSSNDFSVGKTFDEIPKDAPEGTYIQDEKGNFFKKNKKGWSKQ